MTITLPPQLEKQVQEKVATGEYDSPFDVLRDGLRLIEERDRRKAERLAMLREESQVGIDQLDRGEGIDADVVFAELSAKYAHQSK